MLNLSVVYLNCSKSNSIVNFIFVGCGIVIRSDTVSLIREVPKVESINEILFSSKKKFKLKIIINNYKISDLLETDRLQICEN